MIIIDGQQSPLQVHHFENLEQILEKIMADDGMQNRIVTDVLINDEAFSEIYPHQAEDMEAEYIERLEIVSVQAVEMVTSILDEMHKVMGIMTDGGREVADCFRRADDVQALEFYADLLEVNRHFLNMVNILHAEFGVAVPSAFEGVFTKLSELFSEMIEIQENEDWILLADLLEYEYLPMIEETKVVIRELCASVRTAVEE